MKVNDLIEILSKLPPDARVDVWDAYNDSESTDVRVSINKTDNIVLIATFAIEEEVTNA